MNYQRVTELVKELLAEVGPDGLVLASDGTSLRTMIGVDGQLKGAFKAFSVQMNKETITWSYDQFCSAKKEEDRCATKGAVNDNPRRSG